MTELKQSLNSSESKNSLVLLDLKQTYPFISNMMAFAHEYKFDMDECYKKDSKAPKFCYYNDMKQVYMTRDIIDGLADTREKKQILLDYVKEEFDKPKDYDILEEEEYKKNDPAKNADIFQTHFLRKHLKSMAV